jgi:4'-phosphopantetheinyl transferase
LEQNNTDMPAHNDWLSAGDLAHLSAMRFEKRRNDWRLGRWTAKLALAAYLNLPADSQALAEIVIRPAPSGAPEVFLAGKPADVAISLSHSAGIAICAVTVSGVALGCDLEVIEPRSNDFLVDYFTAEEQALVTQAHESDRPLLVTLLWSGKESALKALREGLRLDTRSVVVNPANAVCPHQAHNWYPLRVSFGDQVFQGWWQHSHNVLRTMVATPSPSQPFLLMIGNQNVTTHP